MNSIYNLLGPRRHWGFSEGMERYVITKVQFITTAKPQILIYENTDTNYAHDITDNKKPQEILYLKEKMTQALSALPASRKWGLYLNQTQHVPRE